MITRDGDFWLVNGERIPAKTECAGVMVEWNQYLRGITADATFPGTGDGYKPGDRYALTVEAWDGCGHWELVLQGVQEWGATEPTVAAAQRRVLRVLAALADKLEG